MLSTILFITMFRHNKLLNEEVMYFFFFSPIEFLVAKFLNSNQISEIQEQIRSDVCILRLDG